MTYRLYVIDHIVYVNDRNTNRPLELALDHTWNYIEGKNTTAPPHPKTNMRAGCEPAQQAVFRHFKSPAATLFKALKSAYGYSGASAEFYARQKYDNTKINNHESTADYRTDLVNLAHHVNREITGNQGRIEDRTIAMHLIHSLSPCMRTLQTILVRTTPTACTILANFEERGRRGGETPTIQLGSLAKAAGDAGRLPVGTLPGSAEEIRSGVLYLPTALRIPISVFTTIAPLWPSLYFCSDPTILGSVLDTQFR
ncbi:uncharacterized protein EI90DRAFT_3016702 [Cantharellus anzutake]|uniref:uncharacterized protein n=1 Tax=Cantharellus anzutake TaxID=1750568 RepID=UPI001902EE8B|nr:uncharacterized protein EI90DRAFT_3016702 [Cantharellus anzutake]KAF8330892.1 hypothetical protein EI90DRAFT_3016702 [Cantharellus anzutake]